MEKLITQLGISLIDSILAETFQASGVIVIVDRCALTKTVVLSFVLLARIFPKACDFSRLEILRLVTTYAIRYAVKFSFVIGNLVGLAYHGFVY